MDIKTAYTRIKDFTEMFANSTVGINNNSLRQDKNSGSEYQRENPIYVVSEDNYIGDFIENKLIREILKKIVDRFYGEQIKDIQKNSTKLTQYNYPSFYRIYKYCCTTLSLQSIPDVYITNKIHGINALSVEVLNRRVILINKKTIIALTPDEQAFVVGHELGHHQQGNLVCHTVNGLLETISNKSEIIGPMVMESMEVPLKRWCRLSEFNADRAGYLCCQNLAVIKNLFYRLGMIDDVSAFHLYKEMAEDHPMLSTRWNELQKYVSEITQ